MSQHSKELSKIQEDIKNDFLQKIDINNYSTQPEVQQRMNQTLSNVFHNKTVSELYSDSLVEVPMSQSNFLSQCVQFTEHWTPHRKLKQALIELKSKYGALNTAKNSHFKSLTKHQKIKDEIDLVNSIINKLEETRIIDTSMVLKISSIPGIQLPNIVVNLIEKNQIIDDNEFIDIIIQKLRNKVAELVVKLQEVEYSLKDSDHMVKDALDTASMYEKAVEQYKKEVQESDMSYEEAEMVYYVMFLTWEAENQLRTGDHQLDRGTSKVITQLPDGLRRKVYENINYLRQKYFQEKQPMDGDFLIRTNPELFKPKKTGHMEFEGETITNFLGIEPINQLSISK